MTTERPQELSAGLRLGDWIECDFTQPTEHTRAARLNTHAALNFGLQLLCDPKSGWRRATREWSERKGVN